MRIIDMQDGIRGTFTLGKLRLAQLQEMATRRFYESQTNLLRHMIGKMYESGVGRVLNWNGGELARLVGLREPMTGNTLIHLPDVRIKNGMVLNLSITIPSEGMGEGEFYRLFNVNKPYIERVLETIRDEVGSE
jgi:hypothetical protein